MKRLRTIGIAVAVQARSAGQSRVLEFNGLRFHYAYGAYLGVAASLGVLVAAAAIRGTRMKANRSARGFAVAALAAVLLVALLLPWARLTPAHITLLGMGYPVGVVVGDVTETVTVALVLYEAAGAVTVVLVSELPIPEAVALRLEPMSELACATMPRKLRRHVRSALS